MKAIRYGRSWLPIVAIGLVLLLAGMAGCTSTSTTTTSSTAATTTDVEPIKLLAATAFPPSDTPAQVIVEWGKELEERTGGRYTVELAAGGGLGQPSEYYDLLVNGAVDIAHFVTSYCERPFTMTDIVATPFMAPSAEIVTKTWLEYYKKGYMDDELSEVVPLALLSPPGAFLGTTEEAINTIEDAKGLKVRSIGGTIDDILKAMDCVPVSMSISEAYTALEKGTVDGIYTGFAGYKVFGLGEVVKYANGPALGGGSNVWAMNKDVYDSMPEDVQAIVDDMFEKYTLLGATINDEQREEGTQFFLDEGGQIIDWSAAEMADLGERLAPVWTNWVAAGEEQGLPAQQALDDWYSIMIDLGVENPTPGYVPGD